MSHRILREVVIVAVETALLLAAVAAWGVPGERRRPASVEAAVSFEQTLPVPRPHSQRMNEF
jgi:hypothetical protein